MSDPDEFAFAVSRASLKADFLGRQETPTVVEQFQTRQWTIDFHRAEVSARILGYPPPGWASVALMRGEGESSWYGRPVRRGFLVCTPPGEAIDGWIGARFQCSSVGVPVSVWEQCRRAAGHEGTALDAVVVSLPPARFAAMERCLLNLRQSLRHPGEESPALVALDVADVVASFVMQVWEAATRAPLPRESARNRTRLARRAEDWLRSHHDVALGVSELPLAMGTSRREVEYAFRETFAMSPRDFLEKIRLNAIRRELVRAKAEESRQVTTIALDHGISHLGRFPSLYRRLFGELPSATLARSTWSGGRRKKG
jgi:AraC-like DNA-binding protein